MASIKERIANALGRETVIGMPLGPADQALARTVAIELKRGGVYAIESAEPLDDATLADIQAYLDSFTKRTGCEFLILDAGLTIATTVPRDQPQ
jgi:hypothetical protein